MDQTAFTSSLITAVMSVHRSDEVEEEENLEGQDKDTKEGRQMIDLMTVLDKSSCRQSQLVFIYFISSFSVFYSQ